MDNKDDDLLFFKGGCRLIAILMIAFAIWAGTRPEPPPQRVSWDRRQRVPGGWIYCRDLYRAPSIVMFVPDTATAVPMGTREDVPWEKNQER